MWRPSTFPGALTEITSLVSRRGENGARKMFTKELYRHQRDSSAGDSSTDVGVDKDRRKPDGSDIMRQSDKFCNEYRIRRSEQCSRVKAMLMKLRG